MKGKREEAEVVVRFDQADGFAHISVSSWPALYRKLKRLYGESLDGSDPEKTARWLVPLKTVTFRRLTSLGKRSGHGFPAPKHRRKGQFESVARES